MNEIFADSPKNDSGEVDVFKYPEIITDSKETFFERATEQGEEEREVFDRRESERISLDAHIFDVEFTDSDNEIEFQVSTELSLEDAKEAVDKYGEMYGRLPVFARDTVEELFIFPGDQDWGGNQVFNNVQISVDKYIDDFPDLEEEILLHEAGHAISSDPNGEILPEWEEAISADGDRYLNEYATTERNDLHPEDFSETLVMWYGIRTGAITGSEAEDIEDFVPNRFEFLDDLYGEQLADAESNAAPDRSPAPNESGSRLDNFGLEGDSDASVDPLTGMSEPQSISQNNLELTFISDGTGVTLDTELLKTADGSELNIEDVDLLVAPEFADALLSTGLSNDNLSADVGDLEINAIAIPFSELIYS